METPSKSVTVVGAGAIGGVTAAFLKKAGWNVKIVCKHQEIADRCAGPGIHVFGKKGEDHVRLRALKDITDLKGKEDVALLATKATDCVDAARELLPFLKDDSVLVSLQNGICEQALAEVVGRERVMGCVVGWGATMHGPGELEVTSDGEFVIGNIDGKPDHRLQPAQEMLNTVMPTRISDNVMGELYSKLIINSCINSLGAITGLTLGKMLALKKVRNIFIELIREMVAVAEAMDMTVEPGGGGKMDYYRFLADNGRIADLKRHLTIRVIGFKYRRIKSSSLQSLERGRITEIDFLNGYVCEQGRRLGVPTTLNDKIVAVIKEIESGARQIGVGNLNDPVFERLGLRAYAV
jgi:2-dehydropantoate 2-reductase